MERVEVPDVVEKQIRRVSLTVPTERAGQKVDTLLRK